jgi:hypothetical protein
LGGTLEPKYNENMEDMRTKKPKIRKMHMYQLYQKRNYQTCIFSGVKNPIHDAIDPSSNPFWIYLFLQLGLPLSLFSAEIMYKPPASRSQH